MEKLKLGIEFFVSAFLALIAAIVLLCIVTQQEAVDLACVAIENRDQEALTKYVDQIWDIDSYGTRKETMLMAACQTGNGEAIEYLLNKGADPNKTVSKKLTPLELFCNDGYAAGEKPLIALLEHGVRQSSYTKQPAIFYLAHNYKWMDKEQKKVATEQSILLLQYGAPLGHSDTSLLHLAAGTNMSDLFYTIVHTTEGLYMLTMKNGDGETPWDIALRTGSVGVQKVIRNLENEVDSGKNEDTDILGPINPEYPSDPIEPPVDDTGSEPTEPSIESPTDNTISIEDLEGLYNTP